MAGANKTDKQVMDVSKPGKAPADASARPIIVGHGPMVKDPMVTDTAEASTDEETVQETTPKSPASSKKIISPISDQESDVEAKIIVEEEENKDTEASETTNDETSEPEVSEVTKPAEESMSQESSNESDAAVVDSVLDQVDIGSKREAEQQAEEERKKQEAIDKLVADKKYFVPIGKTHKKTSAGITIFTLFLLLVFLGLIAAIDAEILEVSFNLPFDLIK